MRKLLCAPSAALIVLMAGGKPAIAQQLAGADAAPDKADAIQDIVITAQRRQETSQKAAISITAISGDTLANAGVSRAGDLTALAPTLQVDDQTGPYSGFYLRGVGNFPGNGLSDPAVTLNFDGVTVNRANTSGFFYDLDRVEVLNGPQGTLYGRNATGGTVNVLSKTPVLDELSSDVTLQYGNYNSNREDGVLNVPLGDIAAIRFAAFHTQHSGYLSDGSDDQNDSGGRISFLINPSDVFHLRLVADYFVQGGEAAGPTIIGTNVPGLPTPAFSPGDRFGLFSPQVTAFLATQPDFVTGTTFSPYQNLSNENNRFWGLMATADWKTPVGTLTIIPGYRRSDLDYTSFAVGVMLHEINHDEQKTLEVRLASDTDQRLRYVVGAFYLDDPSRIPSYVINQQAAVTIEDYTTDTTSRAAFASLSYSIVPSLRVSAGVRYTEDDKDFSGIQNANTIVCTNQTEFGPSCPGAGVIPYTQLTPLPPSFFNPNGTITTLSTIHDAQSASYSKTTWRAGLDWDVSASSLLYANVETGFKAGGFFFWSDYDVYQPETITAYSLGSKNRFLDNRLQLNAELFYWQYHNQQISHLGLDSQGIVGFPTENVGAATYKGIEVSAQARPWHATLLGLDVQYEDGVYNDFTYHTPNQNGGTGNGAGCPNGSPPTTTTYTVDCSGFTPPYTPRWTIAANVQQSAALPDGGTLVGDARVHYQTTTLTALDFLPVEYQGGYTLVDFDLTYHAPKERFYVGAYVNNAFNQTAISLSFAVPFSGFEAGVLQPPRTFGIRAGAHF